MFPVEFPLEAHHTDFLVLVAGTNPEDIYLPGEGRRWGNVLELDFAAAPHAHGGRQWTPGNGWPSDS